MLGRFEISSIYTTIVDRMRVLKIGDFFCSLIRPENIFTLDENGKILNFILDIIEKFLGGTYPRNQLVPPTSGPALGVL